MHVMLHAESDDFGSAGKTSKVSSAEIEIERVDNAIILSAEAKESVCTGERGGEPRSISRDVMVVISADELNRILDFAIENKILQPKLVDELEGVITQLRAMADRIRNNGDANNANNGDVPH